MRQLDLNSPTARLKDALDRLEASWMETRGVWNDAVSRSVEEDFLRPMHADVQCMLDTVQKLSGVLTKASRTCRHPRERGESL